MRRIVAAPRIDNSQRGFSYGGKNGNRIRSTRSEREAREYRETTTARQRIRERRAAEINAEATK